MRERRSEREKKKKYIISIFRHLVTIVFDVQLLANSTWPDQYLYETRTCCHIPTPGCENITLKIYEGGNPSIKLKKIS